MGTKDHTYHVRNLDKVMFDLDEYIVVELAKAMITPQLSGDCPIPLRLTRGADELASEYLQRLRDEYNAETR